MSLPIFCFLVLFIGYVQCQWQYGNYPRYGYVYNGGSRRLGFNYYNPRAASPVQQPQAPPRQTVANYYQPGSILNPANLARRLSPTNVKVVDYNEMKAKATQARSAPYATGQIANYAVSRNQIATLNAQRSLAVASNRQYATPSQRQVPHPAFQVSTLQQQQKINQLIQQQQRQQKELKSQLEHQREMLRHVESHLQPSPKQPTVERPPMYNYPRQGFQLVDKSRNPANSPYSSKTPIFQKMGQHFGSSYLSTGAGRAEELRGSLGVEKPTMEWVRAKTIG